MRAKPCFSSLWQMFCWWYYFFYGFLSKNWENRESNSRVHYKSVLTLTIFCWSLSYFLQMFIEDVDGICCFVLVGSFLTQESRESNARVCSCIDNIFVDCCDTYCKCLLNVLMVFVVLCFLALSWLRKAESPTRVCLVCARYLQQEQPNATCACRMPVHAGLSNCYHCAVRPVWLVNCD